MGIFGRSKRSAASTLAERRLWTPPPGLVTEPMKLVRSVPFVFDSVNFAPAFTKIDIFRKESKHDELVALFDLVREMLVGLDLPGLRAEIIVILDDSGSMSKEYRERIVHQLLLRILAFGLNLDKNGIPVIKYNDPAHPIWLNADNYLNAPNLIGHCGGGTPMTEAYDVAVKMADGHDKLTIIINITDGAPNVWTTMSNSVMRSAGKPIFNKKVAVKQDAMGYLKELDDLPSRFEIETIEDPVTGEKVPVKDANDNFVIIENPLNNGIRLIDNVDTQFIDPFSATPEDFIGAMLEELDTYLQLAATVGTLTGMEALGFYRNPAFV